MDRRPLVAVAGFWIAGSGILSVRQGCAALLIYIGLMMALAAFVLLRRIRISTGGLCLIALLLSAGLRLWSDANGESVITAAFDAPDGRIVQVSGRLLEPAAIDGDTVTFPLRARTIAAADTGETRHPDEKLLVRIRLGAEEELEEARRWKRGSAVEIGGELRLPADAGNFGGFDYRRYLRGQNIHWTVAAKGAAAVRLLGEAAPPPTRVLRWFDDTRAAIGRLSDRLYGAKDSGYMKGLVAGITDDIDPGQYDDFSRLGLTHVLAISGLHVAVVVYLLLLLGRALRWTRERSCAFAAAAMPVYMLLTGASPSAVRACLMSMIALWLARQGRLKDGLHLLSAAALIMVIWRPNVVEDVSFQLSFIVTAGLLLYVPVMTELLSRRIRSTVLRSSLSVALTAQLFSFPVTAYYFHQLHLLSLLANLVLVPFISFVVLPLGMAALALGAVWLPLGAVPAKLAALCNVATDVATDRLGRFKALATVWQQPSLLWVLGFYALLLATLTYAGRVMRAGAEQAALAQAAALQRAAADPFDPARRASLVPAYAHSPPSDGALTGPLGAGDRAAHPVSGRLGRPGSPERSPQRRRRLLRRPAVIFLAFAWAGMLLSEAPQVRHGRTASVSFLDVGQGDSILIRTGGGKRLLVDAGGTVEFGSAKAKEKDKWRQRKDPYEVGRKTLVPLLKQRGIRRLDALVLTHLDADHIGGALAVVRELQVGRIFFNGTIKPDQTVIRLFDEAQQAGIPFYAIQAGMSWEPDRSVSIEALYPMAAGGGERIPVVDEQNDISIVLRLKLYGRLFMLSGDLEAAGESAVLAALRDRGGQPQAVDVLKAGHHGSKTSTTVPWLAWWHPAEVVVSVGKNNMYGHPNAGVVARIAESGAKLARTDMQGEIEYRIRPDGRMSRRTRRE
ncbi:ComEC/Rec2 family competence protein [Cohnella sp. 56]|uniref:ComEC/Rec2 family competence protein n=1 Tax=Cohnella sp. 56 TaxID=3113722 RepID=UPI0030E76736